VKLVAKILFSIELST